MKSILDEIVQETVPFISADSKTIKISRAKFRSSIWIIGQRKSAKSGSLLEKEV
jgi:hypothetical protein